MMNVRAMFCFRANLIAILTMQVTSAYKECLVAWFEFNSHSLVTKCDVGSKIICNNKQLDQRTVGIQ